MAFKTCITFQKGLYAALMVVRNDIARRYDVPVFHVLSNKSLIDMAKYRYDCV